MTLSFLRGAATLSQQFARTSYSAASSMYSTGAGGLKRSHNAYKQGQKTHNAIVNRPDSLFSQLTGKVGEGTGVMGSLAGGYSITLVAFTAAAGPVVAGPLAVGTTFIFAKNLANLGARGGAAGGCYLGKTIEHGVEKEGERRVHNQHNLQYQKDRMEIDSTMENEYRVNTRQVAGDQDMGDWGMLNVTKNKPKKPHED